MKLIDVRDAFRGLKQKPWQTFTVFVCLTLGSTLAVLMFGVVNALLAGDLTGIRDRDRLVFVLGESGTARELHRLTAGDYRALPFELPGLLRIGAEDSSRLAIAVGGQAMAVRGRYVSGAYFETLGTQPASGRLIQQADDRPSAELVAVVSQQFAATFFPGGDPIGATIQVGPRNATVVGTLPSGFAGTRGAELSRTPQDRWEVWLPTVHQEQPPDAAVGPSVVARLAPDVSRTSAESGLQLLVERLNTGRPAQEPLAAIRLSTFHRFESDATFGQRASGTAALMAVPLIVLLIACANVAALYASRAIGRTHELSVRVSLGATRVGIARLLALETGLVALAAGIAGWAISLQLLRLTADLLPLEVVPDFRVLLFALVLPCLITIVAGLLPAWRATGFDVVAGLRAGSRIAGPARPRLQQAVLVAQIALSVSLLASAAYLLHSFTAMPARIGPARDDVLVADVRHLNLKLSPEQEATNRARILEQARTTPGVWIAAAGEGLLSPLNGIASRQVTADWFDAVGVAFLAGRTFAAHEARVAVVNETWAAKLGGAEKALGAKITLRDQQPFDVIGVVRNAYERVPWGHDVPVAYVPLERMRGGDFSLYLRGPAAPTSIATLRRILASVNPSLAPTQVGTVPDLVAAHYRTDLEVLRALATMSSIGLILVAVGLFGGASQSVGRRVHEFGVRLALGATPTQVSFLVLRATVMTTVIGGFVGLALAAAVLLAIKPADSTELDLLNPVPALVILSSIIAIGVGASIGPVRRVIGIAPIESLRA